MQQPADKQSEGVSNKAQTMIQDLKRTLILVALANQSSQKRTQLHIPY